MTTTQIATIEELEHQANAANWARYRGLTVYATDSSPSASYSVPGFVYFIAGEPASRDEAVRWLEEQ